LGLWGMKVTADMHGNSILGGLRYDFHGGQLNIRANILRSKEQQEYPPHSSKRLVTVPGP
jgi:hypothetical protein